MVNFDTLNLMLVGDSCISNIDLNSFIESSETDQGHIISNKLMLKNDQKTMGLKSIQIDKMKNEIKIELSAKILKENYFNLININSIENLVKNLNENLGIQFHLSKFIDDVIVLKCDSTNNLKVKNPISDYIKHLSLYRINDRYKVDDYKNESIVFRNQARSFKERMIFYDKQSELKSDKEMMNILYDSNRAKDFENVLRAECNFTSFKKIRETFGIKGCKHKKLTLHNQEIQYIQLVDLLNSKENANFKIFEKITEKNLPTLFTDYYNSGYSFSQIEKREGMKHIIQDLNCDMKLIRKFIQHHVSGNVTRYVRKYQDMISEMKHNELKNNNIIQESIQELKSLLVA